MKNNNTKENILTAAIKLFAEHGYHETSMARIAGEANISKGTLYWYFSGKEELFADLINTGFEIFFDYIKKEVQKEQSADKKLYNYIKTTVNFFEKHKRIAHIVAKNMEIINPEMKEKAMKRHKEMINLIKRIIERGKEENIFRDIDAAHAAVLIIGMTSSINSNCWFEEIDDNDTKVDFIFDLIKNGIANS